MRFKLLNSYCATSLNQQNRSCMTCFMAIIYWLMSAVNNKNIQDNVDENKFIKSLCIYICNQNVWGNQRERKMEDGTWNIFDLTVFFFCN